MPTEKYIYKEQRSNLLPNGPTHSTSPSRFPSLPFLPLSLPVSWCVSLDKFHLFYTTTNITPKRPRMICVILSVNV